MAYYTGTITNANPSHAYVDQIEAAITAYNAIGTPDNNTWTKVESVTSVASWQFEVYKNNGTTVQLPNTFGTDFYVAFGYGTGAGDTTVNVVAGEGYLTGTDSIVRPVSGTSPTLVVNSDYSFGDTTNGITLRGTGVARVIPQTLVTTGFEYHIVVNRDGIFFGNKVSATDQMFYAGLFDPAFSYATFGVPLCLAKNSTSSSYANAGQSTTTVMTSRHPNIAVGSNANSPYEHTVSDYGVSGTAPGDYQTADRFTGKAEGLRLYIRPFSNSAANTGIIHGWLKNCFRLTGPSAARLGDTLTFDSKVHLAANQLAGSATTTLQAWIDTEAL